MPRRRPRSPPTRTPNPNLNPDPNPTPNPNSNPNPDPNPNPITLTLALTLTPRQTAIDELKAYYAEDPKTEPEDVFGILHNFTITFEKAHKYNKVETNTPNPTPVTRTLPP